MRNNKYRIEKSQDLPNWWVLTDLENLIVCRFEQGKFNETQKFAFLNEEEDVKNLSPQQMASLVREMGDYIARHHGGKAFQVVYGFEINEDDSKRFLCRYKEPKWRMEIQEEKLDAHKLASSLKKAAEWLVKRSKDEGK